MEMAFHRAESAGKLLEATEEGTRGCRDVTRLCIAAGVLTQMIVLPHDESSARTALAAVLKTLVCPFPKVGAPPLR